MYAAPAACNRRLTQYNRPHGRCPPTTTFGAIVMRTLLSATVIGLFLAAGVGSGAEAKPVKVLIITGAHGHKWKETPPFLKELLTKAGHKVDVTESPSKDLTAENLAKYDVLPLNYRNTPNGAKENPASVWTDEN